MAMSSSIGEPFFILQSGIVAWEEEPALVHWDSKTLTALAPRLASLKMVLWLLAGATGARRARVFRCHVAPVPAGMGALQQRRMMEALLRDPPGFRGTIVKQGAERLCVFSELVAPEAADMQYISAYRTTALLVSIGASEEVAVLHGAICEGVKDFGATSIANLRASAPEWGVLRVIDRPTHGAVQLVGTPQAVDKAAQDLEQAGIRRLLDVRCVPDEVSRWSS